MVLPRPSALAHGVGVDGALLQMRPGMVAEMTKAKKPPKPVKVKLQLGPTRPAPGSMLKPIKGGKRTKL